jgi:hypothetical protein
MPFVQIYRMYLACDAKICFIILPILCNMAFVGKRIWAAVTTNEPESLHTDV